MGSEFPWELSGEELPEHEQERLDEMPQYMVDQLPTEDEVKVDDHASGVKRGALVSLLTPSSKAQIIQTLIMMDGGKSNPATICKHAGVGRSSWYEHVDDLLAFGVVKQVDTAGNSPLYRTDMDDALVDALETILILGAERRNQIDQD